MRYNNIMTHVTTAVRPTRESVAAVGRRNNNNNNKKPSDRNGLQNARVESEGFFILVLLS